MALWPHEHAIQANSLSANTATLNRVRPSLGRLSALVLKWSISHPYTKRRLAARADLVAPEGPDTSMALNVMRQSKYF
jgi:hypothetical protein